jgi:hypothetical protein
MFSSTSITLLSVALLICGTKIESFVVRRPHFLSTARVATSLHAGKGTLIFTGDCVFKSEPVTGCTREQITEFFSKPETQLFLISAGGKREAVRYPTLTPDLQELWTNTCDKTNTYGSNYLPAVNDQAVAAQAIIQFPGLQLITTTLNGVKTRNDASGLPEYVFLVVGEKKSVSGTAALVWIYNKLTGTNKDDPDQFTLPDATATSVVSIVEEGDESYTFMFNLEIQVKVEFPSALLKILPTSKEKMEEQGSAAVLKAVSLDIVDSLTATREEFMRQQLQA